MQIHHALTALAIDQSAGPGLVMRSVLGISILGAAFLGWFLLRGYRD
jgi:hypothetical protein